MIPWNAKVTNFFLVFCLKYSRRVDLPEPALPVINKLLLVLLIKLKVSVNSLVNSKLSGHHQMAHHCLCLILKKYLLHQTGQL